jgi:hypothetical protein
VTTAPPTKLPTPTPTSNSTNPGLSGPATCQMKLHTNPANVLSWKGAQSFCKAKGSTGSRVATFEEICPAGKDKPAAFGEQSGDHWIAMNDEENGWVNVGRWDGTTPPQTCLNSTEAANRNPDWGLDYRKDTWESNYLYCRECEGPKPALECPSGWSRADLNAEGVLRCTKSWSTVCQSSCPLQSCEYCSMQECADAAGAWIPLDYDSNPYACNFSPAY